MSPKDKRELFERLAKLSRQRAWQEILKLSSTGTQLGAEDLATKYPLGVTSPDEIKKLALRLTEGESTVVLRGLALMGEFLRHVVTRKIN